MELILAMAKVRVNFDGRKLRVNVRRYDEHVKRALDFLTEYHATQGVAAMKTNAPWTDRTSAARNGLYTVVTKGPGHYTIKFSHSVHYGIWLEVKFSGRDAIIMPTVINQGEALMSDIRRMLG